MSFICVDFYGARQMAQEIAQMGEQCRALCAQTGLEELERLAQDLQDIAADAQKACDEREAFDNNTLLQLRPNYQEVLK